MKAKLDLPVVFAFIIKNSSFGLNTNTDSKCLLKKLIEVDIIFQGISITP